MSRRYILSATVCAGVLVACYAHAQNYNADWWRAYSNDAAMIFLFRETSGTNIANYGSNNIVASWVVSNASAWARITTPWGAGAISNSAFGNYGYIGYLPYSNSVTLCAWTYGAHTNPTFPSCLIGNYSGDYEARMGHHIVGYARDKISAGLGRGATAYLFGWTNIAPEGVWSWVAYTYNHTTGVMRLYRNGQLLAQQSVPPGVANNYHPWAIGREWRSGGYAPYWFGAFSEIAVWTRALDTNEIANLFESFFEQEQAQLKKSIAPLLNNWILRWP